MSLQLAHSALVDVRALTNCAQCDEELDPDKPCRLVLIGLEPPFHATAMRKAVPLLPLSLNTSTSVDSTHLTQTTVVLVHDTCCVRYGNEELERMKTEKSLYFVRQAERLVIRNDSNYHPRVVSNLQLECAALLEKGIAITRVDIGTGSNDAASGYRMLIDPSTTTEKLPLHGGVGGHQIITFDITTHVSDFTGLVAFNAISIISLIVGRGNFARFDNPPALYFCTDVPLRDWQERMREGQSIRCHFVILATSKEQQMETAAAQLENWVRKVPPKIHFDSKRWFMTVDYIQTSAFFPYERLLAGEYIVNCASGPLVAVFFDQTMTQKTFESDTRYIRNSSFDLEGAIIPTTKGSFAVAVVQSAHAFVATHMTTSRESLDNVIQRFDPKLHFTSIRVTPPHTTDAAVKSF
jgi:hypothetical protein